MSDLRVRRYRPDDRDAVLALHEVAFRGTGVDPDDIPGTDDLRDVRAAYLDAGGGFVVGLLPEAEAEPGTGRGALRVTDGVVVAMGGFLPNEAGHADERSVAGAAELHRMRVAPGHKRQGCGRRILRALERRVAAADMDPVLATTSRQQPAAVRFYDAHGYERVGESTVAGYELVHFEKSL